MIVCVTAEHGEHRQDDQKAREGQRKPHRRNSPERGPDSFGVSRRKLMLEPEFWVRIEDSLELFILLYDLVYID
jgi:hypothetical protein